jgi:multiple sugar transport system permease protein
LPKHALTGLLKKTALYLFLALFAAVYFGPFLVMLGGSFNDIPEFVADPLFWIPRDFTWDNYTVILREESFLRWFLNSVIITVVPVASQVFFCTLIGYIFARKDFPWKETIFWILMAIIMVPRQMLIIPNYILFSWLGWINTYWVFIIPELWGILGVFLMRQFMQSIPRELDDAAKMDGAGDLKIFFHVILPLSKPAMAAVGTFAFIGNWNDLFTPLIFTNSEEMYPLTVGLATLLGKEGNFGLQMAGAAISFIPTFLVYLFFQRYFIQGIALSGLK